MPSPHAARLGRRAMLGGLGCAFCGSAAAAGPPSLAERIDVHAHFLPAEYRRQVIAAGHARPDGMPSLPAWDQGLALDMMARLNIRTAMLSISSPGVHFGDDRAARELARLCNEAGHDAVRSNPDRFGLFAALPLPDVDGAVAELTYAFDTLSADGVALETNHGGIYLGDKRFEPVFAELNRRRAVLFIHPTSPNCAGCLGPALGYPRPMIEFMFETTRAVTNLLLTRTTTRFPDVRIIVPHAGAALPVLADRIVGVLPAGELPDPPSADEVFSILRRFYYDLAGYPLPRLAPATLEIADTDHLLYGSDWPFTPLGKTAGLAATLETSNVFDDATRAKLLRDNALALFPRLRG